MTLRARMATAAVVAIVIGMAAGSLFVPAARALPAYGWHKEYYNADGYWIAEDNLFCDGSRFRDGNKTGYAYIAGFSENCGGITPPGRDGGRTCYWGPLPNDTYAPGPCIE